MERCKVFVIGMCNALRLSTVSDRVNCSQFAKEAAVERNLTGWVRNTDTGKVEGEVQGAKDILKGFVKELDKGPKHAHVIRVDTKELDLIDGEKEFAVRR
jgi:acylphosphatase